MDFHHLQYWLLAQSAVLIFMWYEAKQPGHPAHALDFMANALEVAICRYRTTSCNFDLRSKKECLISFIRLLLFLPTVVVVAIMFIAFHLYEMFIADDETHPSSWGIFYIKKPLSFDERYVSWTKVQEYTWDYCYNQSNRNCRWPDFELRHIWKEAHECEAPG